MRQVGHDRDQLIRVNRLWQVHVETGRQSAYAIFDSGVCGQRDGWNIPSPLRAALPYVRDQFVPIVIRHGKIRHKRIRKRVFESLERVDG
jgi:hypothetical protein